MPATIVFANGSKRMAHNLDDLRFRWYERRLARIDEVRQLQSEGIVIRDCSNPPDHQTAKQWYVELKHQFTSLVKMIAVMKETQVHEKSTLGARRAQVECQRQIGFVKSFLSQDLGYGARHGYELKPKDLADQLRAAHLEIAYLRRVLRKSFNCEPEYKYIEPLK